MDRSQVEAIIARESQRIARELRVAHWKIAIAVGPTELGGSYSAECSRQLPYETAEITIDPDLAHTEADVIGSIRHEMMHVVLAPFDMLWEVLTRGMDDKQRDQAEAVWRFSVEQSVLNLERMYEELTSTHPAKKGIPLMKPAKARTAAAPVAASKAPANPGMKKPKGTKKGGCK
jgi:hypothetical protein